MRRPPTDAEYVLSKRITRYLLQSERVVAAVRRHPAQLTEPIASTVGALLLVLWVDPRIPQGAPVVLDVLWWAWFLVAGRAAWYLLEWRQAWFVATNRRLLLAYGFVTRRIAMMPLSKVTDLSYNRSPLGRLLGYGEFVLESAGQDQALRRVPWVRNPDRVYRLICTELFDPDSGHWRPRDKPRGGPDDDEIDQDDDEPDVPVGQDIWSAGPREADTGEIRVWPRPVD